MSDEIKQAVEAIKNVNTAFEEFKKVNDQRLAEIEKKGAADPLLTEKLAKIEADMQKAQEVADAAHLAVKRQSRIVTDETGEAVDLDKKAFDWAQAGRRFLGKDAIASYGKDDLTQYKSAFNAYIRSGEKALSADQFKALSVGGDPDGGYLVNPDTSGRIVRRVFETSPMRAYASVQAISSDALEGTFDLNEAGSGWVGEKASRPETTTPQIGEWRIPTHELYARPFVTQKMLDDSSVNIEAWLAEKVADRFARQEALAFVSGSGVGQPRGFLTFPAGTTIPGQIEQVATSADGAFAANPGGLDRLITALYSLKGPYRANAAWFMNRKTIGAARILKDSDGMYQWQPSAQAGQPSLLLGYPVAQFDDMPDIASGSLSIAVGDMREAYQIVDRIGIRTLRDPYSNKPYVEFYSTKRVGGSIVNFEAIKLIRFATSV
jgi:HK97 family phage major capsid protein